MELTACNNINKSKVFLRVDFDVSLDKKGKVESDYRIKRCVKTISQLKDQQNKIALFTKIGRPKGKKDPTLSTINILQKVQDYVGETMFIKNIDELQFALSSKDLGIYLYENTRFFEWEKNLENKNVSRIANLFDFYVDESFATSHREESSNFQIPKLIEKVAYGLNYKKEIENLNKIRDGNFSHPSLFVLGGAKTETKIPMVEKMVDKFTYIIVGGKLCSEKTMIDIAKKYKNVKVLKNGGAGFDIDSNSTDILVRAVSLAKTVVWNGPVGLFEDPEYSKGTVSLINAFKNKKGVVVAGGGDTISAIEKFGNFKNFTFISTGGGAMFSYLLGNKTNMEKMLS